MRVGDDPQTEGVERASLIDWLCVRAMHAKIEPADVSTPMTVRSDGRWAFCPGGLTEDADHLWFATGGITRTALARFPWPSEAEVLADG